VAAAPAAERAHRLTDEASRGPVGLVAGAALVWCERMRGPGGALRVRVCVCACAHAVLVSGQLLHACGGVRGVCVRAAGMACCLCMPCALSRSCVSQGLC
jgi:hypothetical protein